METTIISELKMEKLSKGLNNAIILCTDDETLNTLETMYLGFSGSKLCEDITTDERESVALLLFNLTKMIDTIKQLDNIKDTGINYLSFIKFLNEKKLMVEYGKFCNAQK